MIRLSFLSALFLSLTVPISGFAKVEKVVANLSKCNASGIGSMGIAYKISDAGHMVVNDLFKNISKLETEDDHETMTYTDPFEMTKGKTVVTMKKENGRPVSVETKYDPASPIAKGFAGTEGISAQGARFAYNKSDCTVSQSYRIMAGGKEKVDYDAALCGKILELGEAATVNHLAQCKSAFAQIWDAINKAKKRLEAEGKDWSGMGMTEIYNALPGGMAKKDEMVDHDWQAIGTVGICNLYRSLYGEAPATTGMMPYGMPGAAFGAGMGGPFAPGPAPTNSAE